MNWGAIVFLSLMVLHLIFGMILHGRPRDAWDFRTTFIDAVLTLVIFLWSVRWSLT